MAAVVAEVVVACPHEQLDATITFLGELGFRMLKIFPADAPRIAVLEGHGCRLRLAEGAEAPATIRLACADSSAVVAELVQFDGVRAPNGSLIEVVDGDEFKLPPVQQECVVSRMAETDWGVGRSGMRYRDLVPGRQGGRFVGSHIQIETGGPVGDYVHFHKVRFQALYCYRGWAKLVYEGQGDPFIMQEGDCVLQPPGIRHRVLESSAGLEVIEIACPAEHETLRDHQLSLPTAVMPSIPLGPMSAGQRFVWHRASEASWAAGWSRAGTDAAGSFEHQELGITEATNNLAQLLLVRPSKGSRAATGAEESCTSTSTSTSTTGVYHCCADAEFHFLFVLTGSLEVLLEGEEEQGVSIVGVLSAGDSVVLPGSLRRAYRMGGDNTRLLEVFLPLEMANAAADDAVAPAAGARL